MPPHPVDIVNGVGLCPADSRGRVTRRFGPDAAAVYALRVAGHLDDRWSQRFEGLTLTREPDGTTSLIGTVADQAALHGLLAGVRDLGLTLISVAIVELPGATGPRPTPVR